MRPSANSVIGGVLAIVVANWAPHLAENYVPDDQLSALFYDPGRPLDVLAWPFFVFVAVLMTTFVVQSLQFAKPGRTMAKIAGTLLVIAYVGLLGSFTIQMRWCEGHLQGILALVFMIATAKGADTGAYALGRLAGRHKLWPRAQPEEDRRRGHRRARLSGSSPRSLSRRSPGTGSRSRPSTGPRQPPTA